MTRALFIDKDGTLVEDVPYNVDPDLMRLTPGADAALAALGGAGYEIVVVSNQSGVARGRFREEDLAAVESRLRDRLADAGVSLRGFYYCPHHPAATVARYRRSCGCRKPRAGMLLRAADDLGLDLGRSWMVGDILDDIEAGRRAGCRTALVSNGNETEWMLGEDRIPDLVVGDLMEAARRILEGDGDEPR